MKKVFELPAMNLWRLEARIAELNARAEKLNLKPVELNVLRKFKVKENAAHLIEEYNYVMYVEVEVSAEIPVIEGWRLLARIEKDEIGALVFPMGNVNIDDKYRHEKPFCDHCNSARVKKHLLLLEKDGEIMRVGKTCAKDFLDNRNIEAYISYGTSLEVFFDENDDGEGEYFKMGGGAVEAIETDHLINLAAHVIDLEGFYVPANDMTNKPTKDGVLSLIRKIDSDKLYTEVMSDAAKATADGFRAFYADAANVNDDFTKNVAHIIELGFVTEKKCGLIIGAVGGYLGNLRRAAAKAAKAKAADRIVDEHVGSLKERLTLDVEILGLFYSEGFYGTTEIVKMLDAEGHLLTWFNTGSYIRHPKTGERVIVGDVLNIAGTVKAHDKSSYDNNKASTILTRVKVKATVSMKEEA